MKLFTALFDLVLLPVAIVKDSVMIPIKYIIAEEDEKSETRKAVEKIDEDLES